MQTVKCSHRKNFWSSNKENVANLLHQVLTRLLITIKVISSRKSLRCQMYSQRVSTSQEGAIVIFNIWIIVNEFDPHPYFTAIWIAFRIGHVSAITAFPTKWIDYVPLAVKATISHHYTHLISVWNQIYINIKQHIFGRKS